MANSGISYTNRDIKALREELIEYAKTLTDDWSDFNESDLGIVFVELMAGIADMLNFYLDKQALEVFLSTVKQRKNGKGILSILNYKFKMVTSCTTSINCEVLISDAEEFTIPRYSKVIATTKWLEGNIIPYVTAYDYTVTSGTTKFQIPVIQGTPITVQLAAKDIPSDLKIYLSGENIAEGSIILEIDGVEWQEVDDVLLDDEDGPKFSVYETKDDVTYIMLHPSYKKYLPIDTTINFNITYLESLGPDGIVAADCISSFDNNAVTSNGYKLSEILAISNSERSSGGAYRESLANAKKRAINNLYTMKTAVVLKDYADLAETVPGILKAEAIDWSVDDSKYVSVPYLIKLYMIPEHGDYCSEYQLSEVKKFLDERKTSTVKIECHNAEYVDIDIDCDIYTTAPESKWSDIKKSANDAIVEMFTLSEQSENSNKDDKIGFGLGVMHSNLNSIIETSSTYISYIDLKTPLGNVILDRYQFPRLGNVNLTVKKKG